VKTYLPTQYKSDLGESLKIVDLAKDMIKAGYQLTFDERYLEPGYKKDNYTQTCFKEIEIKPMQDKLSKSLLKKQKPLNISFGSFVLKLKSTIKKYIESNWETDRKKVMLHSAGFDSRIISGIIAELREEKGEDWIGEIHFRCHQPEGEMFTEIMKRERWREDQYSLWEDIKGKDDHYNLGRIEPVNGFLSHIQQYDFFSDIVDKDTILIGGIYGGELFDYPARGKKHFTNHKYCENELLNSLHNYMLHDGETVSKYAAECYRFIAPYLSVDYLKVATRCPKEFIKRRSDVALEYPDEIRAALVESFDFNILDIPYCRHDYHWNTTEKTWNKMKLFYYSSMFFDKYKININIPFKGSDHDSKLWAFSILYEEVYKA